MADPREKSLPKWAQEMIRMERVHFQVQTDNMAKELEKLRPKVELQSSHIGALEELIQCAYKGGYTNFAEVVKVFESYGVTLIPEDKS